MKKVVLSIFLVVINIIVIILNFNSALQGGAASLFDFIVTVIYLCVWIFIFIYSIKHKEHNLVLPSTLFWMVVLLTTLVTICINVSDVTINFIVPFVTVFLTPLYGFRFLVTSYVVLLIIIAIISSYFIYYGLKFIIRSRNT